MTFPLVKLIKKYIEVFQIKGNSFFTFNSTQLKYVESSFIRILCLLTIWLVDSAKENEKSLINKRENI